MNAFYDLARCPPTYDVVTFLSHVEMMRKWQGEKEVSIGILPGPCNGFRQDKTWPQDVGVRRSLLEKIVVPMCRMLPGATVMVETDRAKAKPNQFGVGAYFVGLAQHIEALRSGSRPLRPARELPKSDKLVTITLRECEHWPERNSNVEEWIKAARAIERKGYEVQIIRDERMSEEEVRGFKTVPSASRDLELRAMLYRAAVCNLFVNNGPAWFAVALDAPMLMVKPTTEVGRTNGAAYFAECGVPVGSQLPTSPKYQCIAWVPDTADEIERAFGAFMEGVCP